MLTNEELLRLFAETLSSDFERYTEGTINQNVMYARRFLDSVGKPALEVSQSEIKNYLVNLHCVNGNKMNIDTKQVHLSKIRRFFNFLYTTDDPAIMKDRFVVEGYQRINPVEGIPPINASKAAKLEKNEKKVGLSKYQVKLLLETIQKQKEQSQNDRQKELYARDYAMVRLMVECGPRISDIINLDVSNFTVDENGITSLSFIIQKTQVWYKWPLDIETVNALDEYWKIRKRNQITQIAFTSKTGKRMTRQDTNERLKMYAKLAGLDATKVSNHIMRHTCGALATKRDGIYETKKRLGHTSLLSTARYTEDNGEKEATTIENRVSLVI